MSNTKITPSVKAKITWLNDDPSGAKKAAATITIADSFQVHGVSIVEGPKGLFISMPQRQTTDKKFLEVAHPVTAEMRKAMICPASLLMDRDTRFLAPVEFSSPERMWS